MTLIDWLSDRFISFTHLVVPHSVFFHIFFFLKKYENGNTLRFKQILTSPSVALWEACGNDSVWVSSAASDCGSNEGPGISALAGNSFGVKKKVKIWIAYCCLFIFSPWLTNVDSHQKGATHLITFKRGRAFWSPEMQYPSMFSAVFSDFRFASGVSSHLTGYLPSK